MNLKTSLLFFILLINQYQPLKGKDFDISQDSLVNQVIEKSIQLKKNNQLNEAIALLTKEKERILSSSSKSHLPKILLNLISLYNLNKEFSKAILSGKELLQIAPIDSITLMEAYRFLGTTYSENGDNVTGLEYFFKSLSIAIKNNDKYKILHLYHNIGNKYYISFNYEKALAYYKKANHLIKKYNFNKDRLYYNQGRIYETYITTRKLELARAFIDSSFISLKKYPNKKYEALSLFQLGRYFFFKGMYDSSIFYYKKTLPLYLELNDQPSYLRSLNNISGTYVDLKEYDKSIEYGLKINKEIKNDSTRTLLLRDLSHILYRAYSKKKDYKNALDYYIIHKTSNDAYTKKINLIELEKTQVKYETEKIDLENQSLKKIGTINQQVIDSQEKNILYLVIGLMVILAITVAVFRTYLLNNRLSKKVQLQSDKLKSIDEAKSRFFANISHDLRSPLTLIMGGIEQVLADKELLLTQNAEKLLRTGYANGNRIIHLTKEINELIQLEDGKLKISLNKTDIIAYLDVITGMFHSAAQINDIDLKFINNINPSITQAIVNLDVKQFEKVMYNLISNAFKHTQPKDSIHIILSEKNSSEYSIVVKDTGEGIPSNNLPYVFDRYYQAPKTTFKTYEGFGLGLALVKEIVTQHNGEVWVNSHQNIGSEFGVSLSKTEGSINTENDFSDMSYITEKQNIFDAIDNHITKGRLSSKVKKDDSIVKSDVVILIVEDHSEVREYIKNIVERKYNILEAINGEVALKILKQEKIGLVITDLMMPFFDGFQLLEEMKTDEDLKAIPALVVSARSTDQDKQKVLSTGINDFLSKPFNVNELLQRIENLLNQKDIWNNENKDAIFINDQAQLDNIQKEMLNRVDDLIMNRIEDPTLGVLDLANEMIASERQVFRMIKQLTELTPLEYIKEIRWKYVHKLLTNHQVKNASEAGRAIGIKNVSHFKLQFKSRFGYEPNKLLS